MNFPNSFKKQNSKLVFGNCEKYIVLWAGKMSLAICFNLLLLLNHQKIYVGTEGKSFTQTQQRHQQNLTMIRYKEL